MEYSRFLHYGGKSAASGRNDRASVFAGYQSNLDIDLASMICLARMGEAAALP